MLKKTGLSLLFFLSITHTNLFASSEPSAKTATGSIKAVTWLLKQYNPSKKISQTQKTKNEQLKKRLSQLIDLRFMGRLAMQDHWTKMSEAQKKEFYRLFVPLVEAVAYTLNANYFSGDNVTVTYKSEKELKNGYTKVYTQVYQRKNDINVQTDYLLYLNKKNGEWIMCNLFIDNSSLIKDYRNQFNTIIRRWGIQRLFALMKKKYKEFQ